MKLDDKFKSGRFWMTLCASYVFVYLSINGLISGDDALVIIAMVFSFYFGKSMPDQKPPEVKL